MSLNPKLARHADEYIIRGQFWDFMDAVNEDFNRFTHEAELEESTALTFIKKVLQKREEDERTDLELLEEDEYVSILDHTKPFNRQKDIQKTFTPIMWLNIISTTFYQQCVLTYTAGKRLWK